MTIYLGGAGNQGTRHRPFDLNVRVSLSFPIFWTNREAFMHNSTMPPFSLAFPSLTAKVDSYHIIRQHLMPYSKGGAEGAETMKSWPCSRP